MTDAVDSQDTSVSVDAHVHLWDTAFFDLPWLERVPGLAPRYTHSVLRGAMPSSPGSRVIAVQAGETLAEAEWLLEHAASSDDLIAGVVLQFDPLAGAWAGAVTPAIESDAAHRVVGIRIPLQRGAADWDDLEGLDELAHGLSRRGLVLELLVRPDQLAAAARVAAQHPDLAVVLCHLGLGAREPGASWHDDIARLGELPNVSAKISGVFSGMPQPDVADEAVRHSLARFGADRLMVGSDWPMSTLYGSYASVRERTEAALGAVTAADRAALWGVTAARVYRLGQSAG